MDNLFLAIDDEMEAAGEQNRATCSAHTSFTHSVFEIMRGEATEEWKKCLTCDGQVKRPEKKSCRKNVCEGIKGVDASQACQMVGAFTFNTRAWEEGAAPSQRACVPCKVA
jgi:ribosomal protein L14E/L6E/L27E